MALAITLLLAPNALAGGPTSVLIVSPASHQTAARYYSDQQYSGLMTLLGEPNQGQKERPPGLDAAMGARQINVTWMVHDLSPWRVDRVYPSNDTATVWIHTAADIPRTENGYWHRARRPAELRALLTELGVMGPAREQGSPGIPPGEWTTPPADPQSAQDPQSAEGSGPGRAEPEPGGRATLTAGTDDGSDTATSASVRVSASDSSASGSSAVDGWWWTLPGLVLGAALALLLRGPALRTARGSWRIREPGPRQELRDVEHGPDGP
ncbi:hypothetical protein [Streptomyces sp. cg36]|uniref:hypothetical protein n=1 Tax=Streptomyces sp. cg36 TaxID=3238798 RepID=UPI0034E2B9B4